MKNKNSSKILVAVLTAFIVVIGALSGYFLVSSVKNGSPLLSENNEDKSTDLDEDSDDTKNNNNDAQNKDDDTSIEESRREENYTGPTICQVDQYIYNSDGKIIKDFHDGERYYLEMTVNADASEAILVYNNICYYIDADLNMTEIATDVTDAGICFDGGYCYYVAGEDGSQKEELFIYDIWNQTKESLYIGNVVSVAISPNGRTAAISAYGGNEKICIVGLDLEKSSYDADDRTGVVAVSNDGNIVYFNQYGGSKDFFKCIDHGKEITLSNDYLLETYYTKKCDQIMYMDDDGVKYYKAGNGEPTILTSDTEELRFDIAGGKKMPISFFTDHYILDTNSFSDALMMHSFDDCYAFSGLVPEMVCLTSGNEKARNFSTAITDNGPTCIGTSGGDLVKFTYDGKDITETLLCSSDESSPAYAANRTLDKIWFIMDNDVYYVPEGKDPVLVADQGQMSNYEIMWDPFSDKCYYVKDNMYLCRVGTDGTDDETIYSSCKYLTFTTGEDHLVGFYDLDGKQYIVIGDEIIEND